MGPNPCIAGCVHRGHHATTCGTDTDCGCCCHRAGPTFKPPCDTTSPHGGSGCGPHPADPDCPGCLPQDATHGLLCGTSWRRLSTAVILASDLVIHLRAGVQPGSVTHDGSRTKRAEAPLPLNAGPLDAADRIYVLTRAAVGLAVTELPGMVGPPDMPAWRTYNPDNGMPVIAGLPDGSTGVEIVPYATWLWTHLEHIADQPWVADLITDPDPDPDEDDVSLTTAIHRAHRTWPLNPPETPRSPVKCPHCGSRGLVAYTSTGTGLPPVLSCALCEETFTVTTLRRAA